MSEVCRILIVRGSPTGDARAMEGCAQMGSTHHLVGVFGDLNPNMFHFAGCAVIEDPAAECGLVDFIDRNVGMLRAPYAAAGGVPNPVVFLVSTEQLAGFLAWDGEAIDDFVNRLVGEAARGGAARLFFYPRRQVAAVPSASEWGQRVRGSAIDEVDLSDLDSLHDGIVRYAEEVAAGQRVRMSGILEVNGDERLIDTRMQSNQPIAALEPILGQFMPPGSDRQ